MRHPQSAILYLFLALIVLVGLGLFIFKDAVVDGLLNNNISGPVVNVVRTNQELKLDILRDSRVKALKNYVSIFNYEDLNASQEIILGNAGKQDDVVISNPDAEEATSTSTSTKPLIRVRVGNSNPFLINKDVK